MDAGSIGAAGLVQAGPLDGLSDAEAARRHKAGEGNNAVARAGRSYAAIIWQATFVPVNLVLFAVSASLVFLGLPMDAGLTSLPVLLNIVVSAAMEAGAKWRIDRLRILSTPGATVIREGTERSIDPSQLVRGDLIVIRRGDQIPLDGEVVDGQIEVDESLLTGESDPAVRRLGRGRHVRQRLRVGLAVSSGSRGSASRATRTSSPRRRSRRIPSARRSSAASTG